MSVYSCLRITLVFFTFFHCGVTAGVVVVGCCVVRSVFWQVDDYLSLKHQILEYAIFGGPKMSDDDRDIDVESDAEKRAHHNALERKRRDHIKDSFSSLRDSVPALNGEKVASRAQILKKAAEYILFMRKKNNSHQQDIEDLKRQNSLLEAQIRTLEKAKVTGSFGGMDADLKDSTFNETESDTSDTEGSVQPRRPKKMKVGPYH